MTQRSLCASAAMLSAALLPVAGVQAQGRPPVTVSSCSVLQYVRSTLHPFWRPFGPYAHGSPFTDGIEIRYVNHGPTTAARIAFLVNYRGDVQHIIDAGTFSPGATIDHTFGQFTGDAYLGPQPNACRVVAVRFADGSVWRANPVARRQGTMP